KGAFAKAIRLAPEYLFGGFQLFAAQCDDKEFDAAAKTLQVLRPHAQTFDLLPLEVRLACGLKDENTATTKFVELCAQPLRDDVALRRAMDAMHAAGWSQPL